jgi:hypothetical protein
MVANEIIEHFAYDAGESVSWRDYLKCKERLKYQVMITSVLMIAATDSSSSRCLRTGNGEHVDR